MRGSSSRAPRRAPGARAPAHPATLWSPTHGSWWPEVVSASCGSSSRTNLQPLHCASLGRAQRLRLEYPRSSAGTSRPDERSLVARSAAPCAPVCCPCERRLRLLHEQLSGNPHCCVECPPPATDLSFRPSSSTAPCGFQLGQSILCCEGPTTSRHQTLPSLHPEELAFPASHRWMHADPPAGPQARTQQCPLSLAATTSSAQGAARRA
mmetsp:Transcript_120760/g.352697  ORF Transcript_120760/g.352697 Transcript_120760/m.352697 type:complete len:209 (-) Transcript_120760:412-1038(-)